MRRSAWQDLLFGQKRRYVTSPGHASGSAAGAVGAFTIGSKHWALYCDSEGLNANNRNGNFTKHTLLNAPGPDFFQRVK
jgi:hypothetical protein